MTLWIKTLTLLPARYSVSAVCITGLEEEVTHEVSRAPEHGNEQGLVQQEVLALPEWEHPCLNLKIDNPYEFSAKLRLMHITTST